MTRCPTHDKPLVRTHGGSLICIPCYFAKCKADRNTVIQMTSKTTERSKPNKRQYSKTGERYQAVTG